jgi:dipeptidyl aminopeptidase/acylaminoacyl peptidase
MPDYASFLPVQRLATALSSALSISADGMQVAYASDASGQFNLVVQPAAGGPARQLTSFTGKTIRTVAWSPDGSRLAFTADANGDGRRQVFLIDADGGNLARVTEADDRSHGLAELSPFSPDGRYLLYRANDRDPAVSDIIVHDLTGAPSRRITGIAGRHNYAVGFSPDGRWLLSGSFGSNTDYRCHLADLAQPEPALEAVPGSLLGASYMPGCWDAGGHALFVCATEAGDDQAGLVRISLPDGAITVIHRPGWDFEEEGVAGSADGSTVLWAVNRDGQSVLHAQRNGEQMAAPALPEGVIRMPRLSADGLTAALLLDTPDRPMEVAVLHLGKDQPVRYLTDNRPPVTISAPAVRSEFVHYPAKDGAAVPALLYRPSGPGPHPVLMHIHGGPESQARPVYNALFQCLLASGIGVLAPNVRGSTGYGLAWQRRIYLDWGGIDLDDFEAGASYLKTLDWADPNKIAVMGTSYGGFAALSCLTRLPDLWAAGISVRGPANLETLARSMPPSWAPTVATMLGDPDRDAVRMRERSPVTYAHQITAPLLVIQGANDRRTPQAEADQIVASARANDADVEYLLFNDEGHDFTGRDNEITAHTAVVTFLAKHLREL